MTKETLIRIPRPLWEATWRGLLERGQGQRESACVWVGHRSEGVELVAEVVFLDDFPGVAAFELQHKTSRATMSAMFEFLREKGLAIVADVHTHPEDWVDLSLVDQAHPMEYRPGLLALVLPFYASGVPELDSSGTHIYLGDGQWRRLGAAEARNKIRIE